MQSYNKKGTEVTILLSSTLASTPSLPAVLPSNPHPARALRKAPLARTSLCWGDCKHSSASEDCQAVLGVARGQRLFEITVASPEQQDQKGFFSPK